MRKAERGKATPAQTAQRETHSRSRDIGGERREAEEDVAVVGHGRVAGAGHGDDRDGRRRAARAPVAGELDKGAIQFR